MGILYLIGSFISYGTVTDGFLRGFLMLSAWFLTRLLLTSALWRRRTELGLTLSAVIWSVVGIMEYVTGKAPLRWVDVSRFGDIGGRVCGSFGNPNLFAIFLLFTVPLCLGFVFQKSGRFVKHGALIAFLLGSGCLLLTWSRGAWLAWIGLTVVFLVLCSRRSLSILFVGVFSAIGVIPFLPQPVIRRFYSIGHPADTSASYRIYTWKGVLRMLSAHPWGIGSGERAFHLLFPVYAVSGTESVMHPHQMFLEVWCDLGIIGLILFLWLLWRLIGGTLRFCRRIPEGTVRAEGVSLFCVLMGGILMGCFDSLWYHHGLLWLFWGLCAMLENTNRERLVWENM